jgi:outer membrane protein OmpA-like peptidoglycan-associated protein
MNGRTATALALVVALTATVAGCTPDPGPGPQVRLAPDPPAALAVVVAPPGTAALSGAGALLAGTAQPGEQVQVVAGSGAVLGSGIAPGAPAMAGPVPPPGLPADPTQFQVDSHRRAEDAFAAKLAADREALERALAGRLRSWAAALAGAAARAAGGRARDGSGLGPGISAASAFVASLQQAGVGIGPRRVLVIFGAGDLAGGVLPVRAGSLAGTTVILADFGGSLRAQQEWQAGLLLAGAARAVVLVPAADGDLITVTREALRGQDGPVPAVVHFGLNQASLQPAARAVLRGVAAELNTSCPGAVASILGFADPLGSPARNAVLAAARAAAVQGFLVSQGVAATRLSAAGYGTDLPAAPSQPDGAQSLDRRAVVVIDPVACASR